MPTFSGELINTATTVASLDDSKLRGGRQTVADVTARDAIIGGDFEKTGMSVFVTADDVAYNWTGSSWVEEIKYQNTGVTINESGADVDFRVEGLTATSLLFVDAGNNRVGINTDSPSQILDVQGGNLGLKSHDVFAGSGRVDTTDAVQTTDATETTLASLTLSDDTLYWIEAKVIGRDTSGTDRAMYVRSVRAHRQGGGAVLGNIETISTDETDSAWDVTFDTSTNDVRVRVTGAAATTINWACSVSYQGVSGNS